MYSGKRDERHTDKLLISIPPTFIILCTDLSPSLSPALPLSSGALDQEKDLISIPVLLPCNMREQIFLLSHFPFT